jgi:hypothetical protein
MKEESEDQDGDPANMSAETFTIENNFLGLRLILEGDLILASLEDRAQHKPLITHSLPFCLLEVEREILFKKVERQSGGSEHLVFHACKPGIRFELQIFLQEASLQWQVMGSGENQPCRLRFPFLSALGAEDAAGGFTGHYASQEDLFREKDFPLPVAWKVDNGRMLTFIVHQTYGETVNPAGRLWDGGGIVKNLSQNLEVLFSGELILHEGGLQSSFEHFRSRIRAQFDLSQYQREDLNWSKQIIVQHFTFLYGREILDLDRGTFNIDRLLDEGQTSFGGYDSLILWGTYPRLGVDERTQWDYYDDYPGGRPALRELGERARERGARIFIPYKPWDCSAKLHGHPTEPDEIQLARLVQEVDADGVFLDCMSAITREFRSELDEAKPGVMICSEGRAKGEAFQTITSCWEQSQSRDWLQGNWTASIESMPAVDLWRFIFPEHRLFVISRFTTAQDRKRIIQRGFFNGMGWIVWQDIFGLALPFTPEEAGLLKKCRSILSEYRDTIWGSQPTPLLPVLQPGVYCNEFIGDEKRVWIFYNSNEQQVKGPLLPLIPRPGFYFRDLWNKQEIVIDQENCLTLSLDPYQVGAVVEEQ